MLTYSTARIALSLMIGRGPSATNPSYPSGGTTSSPKRGYANSKPNIKQRKETSQAGEKQDPPENHNRARQLRREYPVRSAITGGRTRTLLTCGIEADTTQRFITGNYHRPHRGEHRPGCAPILVLGFSLNPEVFVEFALHGSPM